MNTRFEISKQMYSNYYQVFDKVRKCIVYVGTYYSCLAYTK